MKDGPHRTSRAVESEIREVRRDMDETLDELGRRLTPRNVLDEVLDLLRSDHPKAEKVRDTAERVGGAVRDNPLPLALIGAGVTWFLMQTRSDARETGEPSAVRRAGAKVAGAAGSVRDSARSTADAARRGAERARSGVRELGERVREGAGAARHKSQAAYRDSPLAAGFGALAAGFLCGLLAPSTRREDEWFGETSERVKEAARSVARETRAGFDAGESAAPSPPPASASPDTFAAGEPSGPACP